MLTRCKSCQLDYIYRENESTYQPDEQKSQCGRNILHIWSHWSHSSIQSHSINSCFHLSVSFFFFLSIEIWIQTTCSSNSSFSPDKNSSTWFRFGCSKCSRLAPLPVKKKLNNASNRHFHPRASNFGAFKCPALNLNRRLFTHSERAISSDGKFSSNWQSGVAEQTNKGDSEITFQKAAAHFLGDKRRKTDESKKKLPPSPSPPSFRVKERQRGGGREKKTKKDERKKREEKRKNVERNRGITRKGCPRPYKTPRDRRSRDST